MCGFPIYSHDRSRGISFRSTTSGTTRSAKNPKAKSDLRDSITFCPMMRSPSWTQTNWNGFGSSMEFPSWVGSAMNTEEACGLLPWKKMVVNKLRLLLIMFFFSDSDTCIFSLQKCDFLWFANNEHLMKQAANNQLGSLIESNLLQVQTCTLLSRQPSPRGHFPWSRI